MSLLASICLGVLFTESAIQAESPKPQIVLAVGKLDNERSKELSTFFKKASTALAVQFAQKQEFLITQRNGIVCLIDPATTGIDALELKRSLLQILTSPKPNRLLKDEGNFGKQVINTFNSGSLSKTMGFDHSSASAAFEVALNIPVKIAEGKFQPRQFFMPGPGGQQPESEPLKPPNSETQKPVVIGQSLPTADLGTIELHSWNFKSEPEKAKIWAVVLEDLEERLRVLEDEAELLTSQLLEMLPREARQIYEKLRHGKVQFLSDLSESEQRYFISNLQKNQGLDMQDPTKVRLGSPRFLGYVSVRYQMDHVVKSAPPGMNRGVVHTHSIGFDLSPG